VKAADPVSDEAADEALLRSGWHREGSELVLERHFASFPEALGFVVSVGALAEAACHHPEVELSYRVVRLRVTTHEIGGLSVRDLELAQAVDQLL
jgi:4a-hydroxytetrahydrobiopterin dehydratase